MLAWVAAHQFTIIGLIWMIVIGPAIGNYACSVVYRLPRGKTPFERHPYCGHCNADLKPIDLFPIWSWVSTRGKCRYCAGPIPSIYTVIEVACGAVFIGYFLKFGMGEAFLLYASFAVFAIIVAAIEWQQGWIAATIYSYALLCLVVVRTLGEHTFFGAVQGAFLMLLLMLIASRLTKNRHQSPFEKPWIWWFVLMGALLPLAQWSLLLPCMLLSLFLSNQSRLVMLVSTALALPLFL